MKWLILILFSIQVYSNEQDFLFDPEAVKSEVDRVVSPTESKCKEEPNIKKNKKLTDLQTVSLNYCFDEYAEPKLRGNSLRINDKVCSIPIEFVIHCNSKKYRDLKIKAINHSFANTKSLAHIPPRGWTTKIVLEQLEEEATEGPNPVNMAIECYTGEKMADLPEINKFLGSYITLQ